jgi:hypothetical protein
MMKVTRLNWVVIAGLLAVAGVASLRSTTATNQPAASDSTMPGVDTSREEQVIGKYHDDLFAYQSEIWTVKKRQVVRVADLDPLERKSDDLKNRLAEVQNAVRDIITKFKAANEFDGLDAALLARVTDPGRRAFYQESSFKDDLEYAASNLLSHKEEISLPLDGLRKRVARNAAQYGDGAAAFVTAAYHPPTAMFGVGLGCRIAKVRAKLIDKNGGSIGGNAATCTAISCACQNKTPCAPYACPGAAGATQ